MTYEVRLDAFEGPLDLLLHLIKKNEINIYDIPIALITRQYLQYIEFMKHLNLDIAGEFLVMAATLTHIKSRLLLPKEETQDEQEVEDPRAELVRRLLEYQRYKEAAGSLEERESIWRDIFHREQSRSFAGPEDLPETPPALEVGLFDLIDSLQKVLERLPSSRVMEFQMEELSIKDKISMIMDRLNREANLTFGALFEGEVTRKAVIVTFLALLELVKMRMLRVHQPDSAGPIWIAPLPEGEQVIRAELTEQAQIDEMRNG